MTVRKIVGEKGHTVVTVLAGDLVSKAVETLGTHKIGAVVVSDGADGVAGILSERDIVRWIAKSGASVLERKVGDLMTSDVVTCTLDDTIADLMGIMTRGKFRHLPVVIDGKLAGIVSIGDVVKYRIAEAEFEARAMRDYIATG
ncbi:MAG: CBS domain-containing protein [Rhodobiaceae bacterium]|nr:CBS domain-containing protein [Rhodobiaceae bacterium]